MQDITEWFPDFKVSAETDDELMDYFLKTPTVERIVRENRWMIIGRKGTGKTAVYEYFRKSPPSAIGGYSSVALSFRDYPWPIHRLYREAMESEISSYQKSWRYIVLTKVLSTLISDSERKGKLPKDLANAKKLMNKLYGNPDPTLLEIIKSKIYRIKKIDLPGAETTLVSGQLGGLEFEDVAENEQLQRALRSNAFQLLEYFESTLKRYISGNRYMIIIDQLDENWLESEIAEYSKAIVNLLLAAQSINNNPDYRNNLRIVVFLRRDIYETLKFNDKNKIYQDGALEIKWAHDDLDEMISERIRRRAPAELKLDHTLRSAAIFENKTVRHGATPLKHILRRSFYRPRDVIVYLNKLREAHDSSTKSIYKSSDLYKAEAAVSNSMYDELIDEWAAQIPQFTGYLEALQNIGFEIFTFDQYFESIRSIFSTATKTNTQEILRFLFENSIVGQKASVNWEYACTNPNIQIDFSKPFHVNNGLKSRLVLTENRERRKKTTKSVTKASSGRKRTRPIK
ncbi:hypothetical protein OCJ37_00255 [Xanthomonas sp. AM6]|uniref:P-loop ATPase, Sll1717 family n=1 Tax=Xanthomonas sp. AM6 TaxID=2982531 RepID=UPI0021D96CB0|nr:hypothetical protein [Xanthomonas sp. AM6]UYB52441.1 hypothetical protein OCJ37_00255 [Xanthomonas sp. AM6]